MNSLSCVLVCTSGSLCSTGAGFHGGRWVLCTVRFQLSARSVRVNIACVFLNKGIVWKRGPHSVLHSFYCLSLCLRKPQVPSIKLFFDVNNSPELNQILVRWTMRAQRCTLRTVVAFAVSFGLIWPASCFFFVLLYKFFSNVNSGLKI